MTDLAKLAERVEQSAGPDRGLDAEIAVAVGLLHPRDFIHPLHSVPLAPAYTASIDAAMALVPDGAKVIEFQQDSAHDWSWWCWIGKTSRPAYQGTAASYQPPLALTAAALRARAHKGPDHG